MKRDYNFFYNLLKNKGVPAAVLPYLLAQLAHESANFKDAKIITHNNPSGIVFSGNKNQKNATKGNPLPKKETTTTQYYYAKFNSIDDWANDYLRIINKAPYYAIKSDSIEKYAAALKAGGYYQDTTENYLKGLKIFMAKYASFKPPAVVPILLLFIGAFILYKFL